MKRAYYDREVHCQVDEAQGVFSDIDESNLYINSTQTPGVTINAFSGSSALGDGARIFNIVDTTFGVAPPAVTIKGLKLTGDDVGTNDYFGRGGAIRSEGLLALDKTTVIGNAAGTSGGGVYVAVAGGAATPRTVLDLTNSRIEANSAGAVSSGDGGGVYVAYGGFGSAAAQHDVVTIANTAFVGNTAGDGVDRSGAGGAIYAVSGSDSTNWHNVLQINGSQFQGNTSDQGGASRITGDSRLDLSLTESTVGGEGETNPVRDAPCARSRPCGGPSVRKSSAEARDALRAHETGRRLRLTSPSAELPAISYRTRELAQPGARKRRDGRPCRLPMDPTFHGS
ncbi:MAG: hypothetical protein KF688_17785 [Pirellulales bacterium]|nr:hypothetical protein [Pirellulales bacterium]